MDSGFFGDFSLSGGFFKFRLMHVFGQFFYRRVALRTQPKIVPCGHNDDDCGENDAPVLDCELDHADGLTDDQLKDDAECCNHLSRFSAIRRAQPLPKCCHVGRSVMNLRRSPLIRMAMVMPSICCAALMVRLPITPSGFAPTARCSHF